MFLGWIWKCNGEVQFIACTKVEETWRNWTLDVTVVIYIYICFYPGFMLETMFFKKAFNCMGRTCSWLDARYAGARDRYVPITPHGLWLDRGEWFQVDRIRHNVSKKDMWSCWTTQKEVCFLGFGWCRQKALLVAATSSGALAGESISIISPERSGVQALQDTLIPAPLSTHRCPKWWFFKLVIVLFPPFTGWFAQFDKLVG